MQKNAQKQWPLTCAPTVFLFVTNFHLWFFNLIETSYFFPLGMAWSYYEVVPVVKGKKPGS